MAGIVVALMGASKVGKDEIGGTFIMNGFIRYAFGDEVKNEYADSVGLSREDMYNENKDVNRPGIIAYGEGKRAIDPHHWVNKIKDSINTDVEAHKNIVITDLRRIPEIDFIQELKEKYGKDKIFLIQVLRPKENGGVFDEDAETAKAIAYAHFHKYVDFTIVNFSTPYELQALVHNIIQEEILKNGNTID